jgi:hypothetical protein
VAVVVTVGEGSGSGKGKGKAAAVQVAMVVVVVVARAVARTVARVAAWARAGVGDNAKDPRLANARLSEKGGFAAMVAVKVDVRAPPV